ncbi:sterol O-acyltransferase [Geosmithia morbida]|uniref:O-acyltransferase n=1 Tax=Geosmithia morbida TaxID=1094350 RepID=A0A9P4YPZ8_9HYPO|nr:sterol O-acyltransferase [Geosmithia morbida]KAF4120998.1 sterol O-acyltransferase [Geosmithia morbida]
MKFGNEALHPHGRAEHAPAIPDEPDHDPAPRSLLEAFHNEGMSPEVLRSDSETPSEEDYDKNIRPFSTGDGLRQRIKRSTVEEQPHMILGSDSGVHIIPEDDKKQQYSSEKSPKGAGECNSSASQKDNKFRNFIFTRQFSAFDRNNIMAANSPFHGFYTLFWMGVAIFVLKISAENWRAYGDLFGAKDIIRTMFSRDVIVLLLSDGIMCGLTGVTWLIQKLTARSFVSWNRLGWILQHNAQAWQTSFIACVVGWTMVREWPWTHTVYFVLHGIVMLMKQHSYAFYNGYLSTVYERRLILSTKLEELESLVEQVDSETFDYSTPRIQNTAIAEPAPDDKNFRMDDIDRIFKIIASGDSVHVEEAHAFERVLRREIGALSEELKGTASDSSKAYPANLGFVDHYKWIPLPVVVYELEYPRSTSISWYYVAEKLVAMVGVLFVMVQISQYSIYVNANDRSHSDRDDQAERARQQFTFKVKGISMDSEQPDFPIYDGIPTKLVWYLIWEIILNILAEITFFADRRFYDAWWNSGK